jgi:uncharacterized protein YggE
MNRSRTVLLASMAVLAGAAFSGLGVAQADDSTTTTTPATIVVNGTDTMTIDPTSTDAVQQATYQTVLGGALTNADQKATFIATQIGATLGSVTNVTETSDSSDLCEEGPIPLYAASGAKPTHSSAPTTTKGKGKSKAKAQLVRTAIIDPTSECSIEADVTVTYDMTPASPSSS